jgi:hypothetical protein
MGRCVEYDVVMFRIALVLLWSSPSNPGSSSSVPWLLSLPSVLVCLLHTHLTAAQLVQAAPIPVVVQGLPACAPAVGNKVHGVRWWLSFGSRLLDGPFLSLPWHLCEVCTSRRCVVGECQKAVASSHHEAASC